MGPSSGYRLVLAGAVAVVLASLLPWEARPGQTAGTVVTGTAAVASVLALLVAGVLVWQVWSARQHVVDVAAAGRGWFVLSAVVLVLASVRLVWVFDRVGPGTLIAVVGGGVATYGAHLVWLSGTAGSAGQTTSPLVDRTVDGSEQRP